MRIANPKDFWGGLLFGGLGLFAAVYAATHYKLGTAVRMGPGYFPLWVGGLVAVLGLVLVVRSVRIAGPALPPIHLRPILFVVAASIAYGYLLRPLGLVAATFVVVIVSALGGHEFRWREVVALAAGLALFSVVVFVYALGLPFQLWPEAFG
ncbi:MAG TPA: tripartite tricarboxylate transporter TctB family protein [Burkholderiales bacterium]|nr:tripartite tricarboxylate transporter TctB family protein [Burkholderiales bacterium]